MSERPNMNSRANVVSVSECAQVKQLPHLIMNFKVAMERRVSFCLVDHAHGLSWPPYRGGPLTGSFHLVAEL